MHKKETEFNKHVENKIIDMRSGIIKSTRSQELLEFKGKSSHEAVRNFFESLPPHLQPKRYKTEEIENETQIQTQESNQSQFGSQCSTISMGVVHT